MSEPTPLPAVKPGAPKMADDPIYGPARMELIDAVELWQQAHPDAGRTQEARNVKALYNAGVHLLAERDRKLDRLRRVVNLLIAQLTEIREADVRCMACDAAASGRGEIAHRPECPVLLAQAVLENARG